MRTPNDIMTIKHRIATLEKKKKKKAKKVTSISEENQLKYQPRVLKTTINKNIWQMRKLTP